MIIAVDGYELNNKFTGVGRYLYNLIKHLAEIDKNNEYVLILKEESEKSKSLVNIKKVILPSDKGYTFWQNFILKKEAEKKRYDILFAVNYFLPFFWNKKSILTVHDISWKTKPEDYSLRDRIIKEIKSRYSFKRAELIFTVSEFSKRELIKYYKIPPEKVRAVHSGVEEGFKKSSEDEIIEFKKKYGLSGSTIIGFIGSMFKRRNIKELIKGYELTKKDIPELKLFLVGKNYYKDDIGYLLKKGEVIWKERLEEKEINNFYSSIDLFVYLSSYEGFGFPPLEALKCGTTPLLLKSSSLEEVFKGIALFIEEASPMVIKNKIMDYFKNKNRYDSDIFNNFKKRENYFSWKRAAEEYLKQIKSL